MIAFHHFGAKRLRGALLAPLLVLFAFDAVGQTVAPDKAAGTSAATKLAPRVQKAIANAGLAAISAPVSPSFTVSNASYATAGTAMRNRRSGAIQISGVVGRVKRAYLYWAFLYSSAPPSTQSIAFCAPIVGSPGHYSCASKVGSRIATGLDTCWRSNGVAIYRSDVTSLISGNGVYPIALSSGASATDSGADPWASLTFPAAEGASLVVIGTGRQTVSVYDRGLAGATFYGSTTYTLTLPGGARNLPVLWDNIGADGQTALDRANGFGVGKEKTYVNGVQIAGPGGLSPDSDWDGGVGSPSPKLWDDAGHALFGVSSGVTALNVRFTSAGATFDCVTPIANVVAY